MNAPQTTAHGRRAASLYGGIQAVRGITFHVNAGEMVALIGANGAGKTSTHDHRWRADRCKRRRQHSLPGQEITRKLPPHDLVRNGIALVPEGRGVFAQPDHRREPGHGRVCPQRQGGNHVTWNMSSRAVPQLKERESSLPGPCRAASSRCWRSGVR